ncbi:MAG: hypothetical protein JW940_03715 [Polyangiaceae bacterium]|nr:hypothetical protein [Polyangiaceae bacterium]
MFKASYNRALVRMELTTVTPLSIRAGDIGLDPAGCELVCIRTRHALHGRTVFVPGSSLKGVLRSTIEAQLRSTTDATGACDPLGSNPCGKRSKDLAKDNNGPAVHQHSCLACRMFGSTTLKGRCSVRDEFPFHSATGDLTEEEHRNLTAANTVEIRPGVAIDRLSGSVKGGAVFEQEMVPAGVSFWGDAALENFQAWQLGLLFGALRELDEGYAQLGSGKTKGLGVVRARVLSLLMEQKPEGNEPVRPKGVGHLIGAKEATDYGLLPEHELPESAGVRHGIMDRFVISPESVGVWEEATARAVAAATTGVKL